MTTPKIAYSDQWGECVDRPIDDCVEIRWFDTTSSMDGDQFNQFLSNYATVVETCRRRGGLVDAIQFKMDPSRMSMDWRDQHITPRYNAAGVKKFAFIMPAGMCQQLARRRLRKGPQISRPHTLPHAKKHLLG